MDSIYTPEYREEDGAVDKREGWIGEIAPLQVNQQTILFSFSFQLLCEPHNSDYFTWVLPQCSVEKMKITYVFTTTVQDELKTELDVSLLTHKDIF